MKVQIKINYFPSSQLSVPSHHSSLWDGGLHGVDGEENDEHEQNLHASTEAQDNLLFVDSSILF